MDGKQQAKEFALYKLLPELIGGKRDSFPMPLNRDTLSTVISAWVLLRYNLAASNFWMKDYSEINRRTGRREFQEAVETFYAVGLSRLDSDSVDFGWQV